MHSAFLVFRSVGPPTPSNNHHHKPFIHCHQRQHSQGQPSPTTYTPQCLLPPWSFHNINKSLLILIIFGWKQWCPQGSTKSKKRHKKQKTKKLHTQRPLLFVLAPYKSRMLGLNENVYHLYQDVCLKREREKGQKQEVYACCERR